jgi:hypothetical protein
MICQLCLHLYKVCKVVKLTVQDTQNKQMPQM